jgi:hypothetical protein
VDAGLLHAHRFRLKASFFDLKVRKDNRPANGLVFHHPAAQHGQINDRALNDEAATRTGT